MLALQGAGPPFFTHAESRCGFGGLGLKRSSDYEELVESYKELFCRRCFIYDCKAHGVLQPRPIKRVDPAAPFPCPVAGLALPVDNIRKTAKAPRHKRRGQFTSKSSSSSKDGSSDKAAKQPKLETIGDIVDSSTPTSSEDFASLVEAKDEADGEMDGDGDQANGFQEEGEVADGSAPPPQRPQRGDGVYGLFKHLLATDADERSKGASTSARGASFAPFTAAEVGLTRKLSEIYGPDEQ